MRTIIACLLFVSCALFGQDFRSYNAVADSLLTDTIVGKKTTYSYQNFNFEIMGKRIKLKDDKKLLLSDEAIEGTRKVIPHVLVSDSASDPVIIIADLYAVNMMGFNIYILNGAETKLVGFLGLVLNTGSGRKKVTASQSLINNIKIKTDGSDWQISFDAKEILVHPGSDREEVIDGDEAKFIYNGKRLKEVKGF